MITGLHLLFKDIVCFHGDRKKDLDRKVFCSIISASRRKCANN